MKTPWISLYEPKDWDVYQVFLQSDEMDALRESQRPIEDHELLVCGAESEMMARRWEVTKSLKDVLFYDVEQLWAMNLDVVYGANVSVLTKEWKGHPTGSLVMETYKGVNEEPRYFTVGVARN